MTLAEYTCIELCVPVPLPCGLESALFELSQCLHDKLVIASPLACFDSALNQCYPGEGDLLGGIAHRWARLPSVETSIFAAGRTIPFPWRAGATPVELVILIAAPVVPSPGDLALLAGIRQLATNPTALEALRAARGARAMFDVFAHIEVGALTKSHTTPTESRRCNSVNRPVPDLRPRPAAG